MLLRAKQLPEQDHIIVNVEYKKDENFLHEISYIEGLKDYVKIYLVDRESPLLTRSNLRGMEKILPTIDFLRIHNSFIVNKNRIEQVVKANSPYLKPPFLSVKNISKILNNLSNATDKLNRCNYPFVSTHSPLRSTDDCIAKKSFSNLCTINSLIRVADRIAKKK
jgi:hypothetical protein